MNEAQQLLKKLLHSSFINFETVRKKKNGSLISVSISCSPVTIDGKTNVRIISYKDITRQKQEEKVQRVLYNISKATNISFSLEKLYPLIHRELRSIIDATNFHITLKKRSNDELYFPYFVDEKDNIIQMNDADASKNISAYVIKTGKALLVNYRQILKMVSQEKVNLSQLGILTKDVLFLDVPIKIKKNIIGSMVIVSYYNSSIFTEKDIKLLEYVSEQIATAIERKRMEKELIKLAHFDSLTETNNRAYELELLRRQVKLANRKKYTFLIGYADLDNLKSINDRFGHDEGDRAISRLAHFFKTFLRQIDIIIRIGGDEFLLVFSECSIEEIPVIKQRLNDRLIKLNRNSGMSYSFGFSIGFTEYKPVHPKTIEELIHIADNKMYKNKRIKTCNGD